MRSPRNIHILICILLFASYRRSQARTVTKLFNKSIIQRNPTDRLSPKLYNDESHSSLLSNANCVQLGLRNLICVYNERVTDIPFYHYEASEEDHFSDFEKHPKEFVDLTRLDHDFNNLHGVGRSQYDVDSSFSEDYLDVGDLSFTRKVDTNGLTLPRTYQELIAFLTSAKHKRFNRRIFSFPNPSLLNFLSSKLGNSNIHKTNNVKEKSSEEEDTSEDSDKPKRFEVIEHSESEESEEVPKRVPQKKVENFKDKYVYMQGPSRVVSMNRRRRLPHFLPKRQHWDEVDIPRLPYLWFNGPQGQFPGIYRTP